MGFRLGNYAGGSVHVSSPEEISFVPESMKKVVKVGMSNPNVKNHLHACITCKNFQGSHRPGKVLEFVLGPGKLMEFENSAFCPGIVLEFCKIILENMN